MHDEIHSEGRPDWRRFFQLDAKSVAVMIGCTVFLVLFFGVLPHWLRAQEQADFGGAPSQTAPGIVEVCQISPVSQGGGGLFNAVTVSFAKRQSYYALPPSSQWKPSFHQHVRVTYCVGRRSGMVRVESVTPE